MPDSNSIVNNHRALLNGSHSQDCYLRLTNDWQAVQVPEYTGIGNGKSPVLDFIRVPLYFGLSQQDDTLPWQC